MSDGWHPLGADTFDLLSCAAACTVIFGLKVKGTFVPLALGRSKRLASAAQWAALIARDRGCIRCGRAPRFCQAHHIHHWKNGGRTDLSNLALCVRDAITICTWVATSSPWTRTRFPSSPRPGDRRGPSVRGLHGPGDLRPWLLKKHRDAS